MQYLCFRVSGARSWRGGAAAAAPPGSAAVSAADGIMLNSHVHASRKRDTDCARCMPVMPVVCPVHVLRRNSQGLSRTRKEARELMEEESRGQWGFRGSA